MLYYILLVLHVIICVLLTIIVLLQSGRGGGLAGAFGGAGASQTMFGGRGAGDVLTRTTQILGASFMTTSLVLVLLGGGSSRTGLSEESLRIIDEIREEAIRSQPGEAIPGFGAELPATGELSPLEIGDPAVATPEESGGQSAPEAAPTGGETDAGAGGN